MSRNATPVRVDRIVLHIGTEKTGTSSIQHFLSNNRAELAAEGVVYPRFTGLNGGSQWGVVAAVQGRPWKTEIGARLGIRNKGGADTYRQRLLEAFDQELLACPGCHTLILSSEHFHSRLIGPARLHALKKLLSRWSDNVQVVVYFRRQDRVAISHYSTKLKTGQAEPRVFSAIAGDLLPYYYDYERIYANWSRVFGEKALHAGIFAPKHLAGGDLLTDFCDRIGIAEEGKSRPAKINESLSETGVQLLLELNRQWPKEPLKGVNPSRELLAASIGREHRGRNVPATRAQAQAFYAHFAPGNARLAKKAFPALVGPLFDEGFSDYPEVLAPRDTDLSAEVRRRIRGWRAASVAEQKLGVTRRLLSALQLLGGAAARIKLLAARAGRWRMRPLKVSTTGLPPVFLHMGLPKTATTTLQETLFGQHPGICYLGKRNGWMAKKHCASEEVYRALRPILWRCWAPTNVVQAHSVLQAYSQAQGPEKPILGSWEALLIKPPVEFQYILREAQNVLGDVHVIATLRNPLKRLPSAYLHALRDCARHGKHHTIPKNRAFIPLDKWLAGPSWWRLTNDTRFDFGKNLRFAVEFLGRDKVGIFLLEDMIEDREAFFASILDFMGVDNAGVELFEDRHLNPALTAAELEFLQTIEASEDERKRWFELSNRERRLSLKDVAKKGDGDKCKIVLSDAQRALIEARSRELNRWLVDTFDLDLARHGYPL
ncbi:hypothetical protein [Gilvimarinus japonicus]|uniref:Sulfotransferase domain-containing protein n=1 Tax=Gilvimarinus japonicus TaxID=1796469 RepID=A0ABV7HS63_9GAMM